MPRDARADGGFDRLARHLIRPDADESAHAALSALSASSALRALQACALRDGPGAAAAMGRLSALSPGLRPRAVLHPEATAALALLRAGPGSRPVWARLARACRAAASDGDASWRSRPADAALTALVAASPARQAGPRPSASAARETGRRAAAALDRLEAVWPEEGRQTRWYVRRLVPVAAGAFEGTIPELPGIVFFRSGGSWAVQKTAGRSSLADLEFLLHESAHHQLLHLGRAFALWETDGRRIVSPWSGRLRPALSLPAALHAYWITYEGLRRAGGGAARLRALRRGFSAGFAAARRELVLTRWGSRFLDLLESEVSAGV